MYTWMKLWSQILAQTQTPNEIQNTVGQATEAIERLGGISPAVQITAGITILLGFMLLILVYEFRRAKTESSFREALQNQAEYSQNKRRETDETLDSEKKFRRQLQDDLAQMQRQILDCDDVRRRHEELVTEFMQFKRKARESGADWAMEELPPASD